MKAVIIGWYHRKNLASLKRVLKILDIELINNIKDADVVFSGSQFVDISKFPNKKFILGPHFAVEPTKELQSINNINNNAIYVQPSLPPVTIWQKEYKFDALPMRVMYFSINTTRFEPTNSIKRTRVMLYYKYRDPEEFKFVKKFLKNRNIDPVIFNYTKTYKETG